MFKEACNVNVLHRRESPRCNECHSSCTEVRQCWSKALNEYFSPGRLIYLLYNDCMNFIHHWFPLHIECCQTSRCRFVWAVINLRNCGPFTTFTFNFSDTGPNVTWINNEYLSHKQNPFTSAINSECHEQWFTLVYDSGSCELKMLWSSLILSETENWDSRKYNYHSLLLCDCNVSSQQDSSAACHSFRDKYSSGVQNKMLCALHTSEVNMHFHSD